MSIIKAHTSIIGETGYNTHARNFFKQLNSIYQVQVRNWSIGSSWEGYNDDEPHNKEYYMDDTLKTILVEQTLRTQNGSAEFPLYKSYKNEGKPDVHIVLSDNNHYYFYENYDGKKIAYNVWETTRQPEKFFENLKRFDQVWVPSEWQKKCTIEQGISAEKVKVVPEGVDPEIYKPRDESSFNKPKNRPFRFLLVGRWDYRKSIKEIIQTFCGTFSENENIEFLLSIDNPFATDGLSKTEERLEKFGISHPSLKIINHQSRDQYIEMLHSIDVFVSCARSEGWNLPLIEAMACGIPSTYSEWGAQLEFAKDKGIPIKIKGEVSANVDNNESWIKNAPGNFCEPNFDDLSFKLRDVYENFEIYKKRALNESKIIREKFDWKNAAIISKKYIDELFTTNGVKMDLEKKYEDDYAFVTCGNEKYMKLIEKLVVSLLKFSNIKIIVYGIDCDVPFDYPNMIAKRISIPNHSMHDKWYWKQYVCIDSLNTGFTNLIWIDGDVIVNHNIDNIKKYFNSLENYPIPDIHIQEEFIGYYTNKKNETIGQLFNQELYKKFNLHRLKDLAHICMYIYNKECKWWFEEILKIYKETPLDDYKRLLQWNDEGIDNLLRSKYNFNKFLPVSNFDVSDWDGVLLQNAGRAMEHFLTFWKSKKPKNFGQIYGWQKVPKDKTDIIYFHGNKNLDFADIMTDFISTQKNNNFEDSKYFFTSENEIKNLGKIDGVLGGTIDIAKTYGWDYAIYHEIFNLRDYEYPKHIDEGHHVKIKKGDVVVDLGGNIGIFSRYAYKMGAEKIVTFEPDRRYFKILKQNTPTNSILFNAAIGDKLGKMILTESEHLGGSNLWTDKNPLLNQYEVNVYTLDYILEKGIIPRIDFLKVDIEGSEIIALNGISDKNLSKIRNIAVEYHHEHLKFDEQLRHNFITRLNKLGFNSYVLFCGNDTALQLIYFWK
jgi:FkbM family methyltransferase